MNPYVVIDIGGTSIKYGLADAKGQLLETHEMPTEAQKGGPHILNTTKGNRSPLFEEACLGRGCDFLGRNGGS